MEKLNTWPALIAEVLKPDWNRLFGVPRPNSGGSVALQDYSLVQQLGRNRCELATRDQA